MTTEIVNVAIPTSATHSPRELDARLYKSEPLTHTIAVVAHPYGPLGGSQDDPVVTLIARTLQTQGILACTFNFSSPTSWTAKKEREECKDVVAFLIKRYPETTLIYAAGYSYGTLCLPLLPIPIKYIVISPLTRPVARLLTFTGADAYAHIYEREHLVLWGIHDQFSSSKRLAETWPIGHVIDTDHFWRSTAARESLRLAIIDFVKI